MEAQKETYFPYEEEDKHKSLPKGKHDAKKESTITSSAVSPKSEGKVMNLQATADLISRQIKEFSESNDCPAALKPHLQKLVPFVKKFFELVEKSIPLFQKLYDQCMKLWESLQPYKPELLFPSLTGLIMCFFGGSFITLIAACEAFTLTSYQPIVDNLKILYDDFQKVISVNLKDNTKDDNNDGIPDVQQISTKELVQRKIVLFLKTVDPQRFMAALGHVQTGFLSIIATLKLEFAKTLTLGNAIYNAIEPPIKNFIVPKIEKLLPEEYRKWAYPIIASILRSMIISMVWFLQRINSALHSSIKGGLMCSRNILEYLDKMGIYHLKHEDTYIDEIVGGILAFLGLWFQLSLKFTLPFPLNILLFPFSILEWFLMWMIAK